MNKLSAKVSPCSTLPPATPHIASTSGTTRLCFNSLLEKEADVRSEESVSMPELGPSERPCRCPVWAMIRIWNLLMFPLYYIGYLLIEKHRETPTARFRKCLDFLGDGDVTVRVLLRFSAPFSMFWSVSGFLYLRALSRTSVTDCSAVMCCNSAFTFLLTWICLKERFLGVRVVAVILSITGIVMLAYSDGFYSDSITGVALGPVPWNTLCTTASLLLVFNVLVYMGGVCTYPALISLGVLLTVPASAAVDVWVLEAQTLSDMRSGALGLISAAFVLLLFPEDWDEKTVKWISSMWSQKTLNA
ncbi:hypothetical protein AMELA_G00149090 [Ameiurus melas]|uniref:EamA domain-containing protein n=1 Tax=Ameiurus melas TaxID=219545 RepID=A0A7J6AHY4_AMEME|nr:hypothetical protein AMELA_G00149090 [Ameiurus melas]